MYTVVLYRKANDQGHEDRGLSIERFRFIFASMEQEDRLVFYEWNDDADILNVIRKIDTMLGSHRAWRLLVFQGAEKLNISGHAVREVDEGLQKVLWYYARSVFSQVPERCKYYPEEIWHVGWVEKTDMMQCNEMIHNRLAEPSVGNLRVFGIVANLESRMEQRYSEFMACCSLLILAINQFPVGFLSSRYLYFIQLEYERKRFAEYANAQYETILEIKRRIDLEKQKQQKMRTEGVSCPEYVPVELEETGRGRLPDIGNMKKRIRWRRPLANIEHALNRNAYEIRGWMNFPRGIMSGKVDKLSEELDAKDMAGGFLSISGRERLMRETRSALERLSIQHKVSLDMRAFEYGLRKREECIRKEAGKRAGENVTWMRKIFPFTFLGLIEAAFGTGLFHLVSFSWADKADTAALGVGIFFFTVIGLELSMVFAYWYAKNQYIRFLKKEMVRKTVKKDIYLNETLKYIAEYQYYIRLGKEQRQLEQQWKQHSKRLEQHMYICRQSEDITQQLQYLLDEEETPVLSDSMPLLESWMEIDFTKEPQEISYYRAPHRNVQSWAELNHSGYRLETIFDFIIRFRCANDYRKLIIDDQ